MEKQIEVKVEKEKKEKVYTTKDIVLTAIVSFLIGVILMVGGFAITKNLNKGRNPRSFNEKGIQRRMDNEELNNNQQNKDFKNRQNMPNNQQNTPPNLPDSQQPNNNQNSEGQSGTQNQPIDKNTSSKS